MKKEILLKKIENLFFWKTFKEVSLQDIANLLEIKKSSLYYYFSSKEDLIEEIVDFSFLNYKKDLIHILSSKDLKDFIEDFIYYPLKSKNIFSIISQSWYCNNDYLKEKINKKSREIFLLINDYLKNNFNFSEEKTFLLLSLIENLSKKQCIFWECDFDKNKITKEIIDVFNK